MSSDFSRRQALVHIGKALVLTGCGSQILPPVLAQHVHEEVAAVKSLDPGNYKPKYLTDHEYKTLRVLADLIVPTDEHSKGALDAGAPEFIDFLCSRSAELAEIYSGGLAWIDAEMKRRAGASFVDAKSEPRTALLDVIAYSKNDSPQVATGIRFFRWVRNMVIDAYYTSPVGIKDLGFMGNGAVSQFSVPKEAVEYALNRSPFAGQV